jgi:hypothetical protein
MNTAGPFRLAATLVLPLLVTTSATASVPVDRLSGDHLVRRPIYIPVGATTTITTSGCGTGEDTVLYLLEGVSSAGAQTSYVTRGFNDDYGAELCSSISYTNNTGVARNHTMVVSTYSGTSAVVNVSVSTTYGGTSFTLSDISVRGARVAAAWGPVQRDPPYGTRPTALVSKPLSPSDGAGGAQGLGIQDTVIFAVDTTLGATSFGDDDGGIQGYSSISFGGSRCNSPTHCHILGGGYTEAEAGKLTIWNNELGDPSRSDNEGDYDRDKIADDIENKYGSAKVLQDTDADGIADWTEYFGVAAAGGLTGVEGSLVMPHRYASASTADVFVEIDYMNQTAGADIHTHRPYLNPGILFGSMADQMALVFANSSYTGRNIALHVEVDQDIGHASYLSLDTCPSNQGGYVGLADIKSNAGYFDPRKRGVYHYFVAGHVMADTTVGGCVPNFAYFGRAEQWGNDGIITIAQGVTASSVNQNVHLGTYLHELGHNFDLAHFNNDHDGVNESCVHSSVMNYMYQHGGIQNNPVDFRTAFTYSNGTCDASSSVSPGGSCANTCVGRCVPAGQETKHQGCTGYAVFPTPVPHSGRVSDGTCDCDHDEWGSLLRLYRNPASDPDYADGLGPGWLPFERRARAAAEARARLTARGLREGRDFSINERTGRAFAEERR